MLRPRKITFYRMMLAGYLSAEAYRALKPKKQFSELLFSDCFGFEPKICNELKKLFEDDVLKERLYCLEKIEDSINIEWDNIHNLLNFCINNLREAHLDVISVIGEKTFALDYLFCSDDCFMSLDFVTDINYYALIQVRNKFAILYKDYLETGALPEMIEGSHTPARAYIDIVSEDVFIVSEPFGDYSTASGKGFSYKDNFVIDDDALGINNSDCKKYVLYLYSLDSKPFEKFQDYLYATTFNCSVRLCNAIKSIGSRNFLVNYLFADDLKFFQIRNFGKKSLFEFNSIKPQIISFIVNEYNKSNTEILEEQINSEKEIVNYESLTLKEKVGEVQYSLLTNLFKSLISEVSVRTQNGIHNYKGDFIEDFVHKSNDVKKIRNIGRKSEIEFNSIISQMREAIDNLKQRELTEEEVYWIEKTSVYGSLIDDYCRDYYKSNGQLPMFHLLANCMSSLREERSIKILDAVVSLFSEEGGNELEDVANEHKLSRERIRQICVKTMNMLSEFHKPEDSEIPMYHKILSQNEDWAYVFQEISEKQIWEVGELTDLFHREGCSMNKEFILLVLSVIFSNQYVIVGKAPLSISSRGNGWSNIYFISKRITDSFDFDAMIDIVKDYESSNTESTTLTIQELLMDTFYGAWKHYDFSVEEDLEYAVGQILVGELGIIPDLDFNYTLEGKKEEDSADILYNLLKESGNPLTIDELYSQLNMIIPGKYSSSNSLRAIINRDPRLCFLGVNNMAALYEWEHIQTGSIRELIVSYLAEFDSPQHIKDIVEYIQKHRDTSERSISSTMGSGDQFIKFAGGYYGLADRSYSEWFNLSESERFSRKRIVVFEEFIKENLHFPFCPSNDKEEENLYQWWSRVKRNNDISDTLKQEINRIESTYSDLAKNRSDYQWLSLCHRYRTFVIENNRKPSGRNPIEVELSKWFSKALDDVTDGKLSPLREREFIKLCKSL